MSRSSQPLKVGTAVRRLRPATSRTIQATPMTTKPAIVIARLVIA
jgi:hypothetical protein